MNLYPIHTGGFKLDGGAMFGVVPQSIWKKLNEPDQNNMCSWAMRCLLVEQGDRLILIDNGIGDKQSDKFFGYYYLHGEDSLDQSLQKHGFHRDDITDVLLTHLHFDHCGGSIRWNQDKTLLEPAFKNAIFWSNENHWKWATEPNPREKASFLKENILPIEESGQLKFVNGEKDFSKNVFPQIDLLHVNGHTESMMIPHIRMGDRTIVFMADLLPSAAHVPLPYVMAYDTRPLLTMKEKAAFLKRAADEQFVLFFEHDPVHECCTVMHTDKGVRVQETFPLSALFS